MGLAMNQKSAVAHDPTPQPLHEHPSPLAALRPNHSGTRSTSFNSSELEVLLFVIDASLKIQTRSSFFSWAQGLMQSVIPHELLVCRMPSPADRQVRSDCFYSRPFDKDCLDELCRVDGGAVYHLERAWKRNHCQPLWHESGAAGETARVKAAAELNRLKLSNLVGHGVALANHESGSFFALACVDGPISHRHAYVLELLVPFMHAAWVRVQANTGGEASQVAPAETVALLTMRELEILGWVHEGKSNIEIGTILQISSLTVKNHVQKILRKLNVQNRTQAVGKALGLKLIKSS